MIKHQKERGYGMGKNRTYICIDLKSFYASVECKEMGLDPMTTNLVVADPERSEKTICLAVSPAMKKLGVPGRCRLFEIPKNIEYTTAVPQMQTLSSCFLWAVILSKHRVSSTLWAL